MIGSIIGLTTDKPHRETTHPTEIDKHLGHVRW